MKLLSRFAIISMIGLLPSAIMHSQTVGTFTQTVNQRGTISELSATPITGVDVGTNVTFNVLLDTAGAPAVTTENITYSDSYMGSSSIIGTEPLSITNTTNLLTFSQDFTQWTTVASGAVAPTLTALSTAAPDGTTLDPATIMAFPATPGSAQSGVTLAIPGTAYAGESMTASIWLEAATDTTVSLQLTDSPQTTASQVNTCNVATTWTRCSFTYAFPANAGTGFALTLFESGAAAQSINVWGAQVEQAAAAGTYVYTDGTSQSRQGGASTFSTTGLLVGTHVITANYGGDANFLASVSQPVTIVVGQGTAAIALTESAPLGAVGAPVTFTATLTGPDQTPTGTVNFMDGATQVGQGTITAGVATFTTNMLAAGTHTITAVYTGNAEFDSITSTPVTYTASKVNAVMAVTSTINPSIYGQTITITITMTGAGGIAPTGSVSVLNGVTSLGSLPLTVSGATSTATITTSTLNAGANNFSMTYSGDNNYN